jgi:predicted O-methyltransferase YrrM
VRFNWLRRKPAYPRPEKGSLELISRIDEPFRAALLSMYRNEPQRGSDSQLHTIDPNTLIPTPQGLAMYDFYRQCQPENSIEVGMAYGFSTLFFAAAMAKNGHGQHAAIDPFEHSGWQGIGLEKMRDVGTSIEFIEQMGTQAAAEITKQGRMFDLIFIDGNHRFDDVLVDFTVFAPLVRENGHILFDDMWLPSVRAAVAFIQTNRSDFMQVAFDPSNVAAFKRVGRDARPWNHFEPFHQ